MTALWEALGSTFQPVLVSIATVAVLALLRLITPTVRWSRRLKHDSGILAALPDGKEKDLWAASVTAQAERLRIYREDFSFWGAAQGWYSFVVLVVAANLVVSESVSGWALSRSLTVGDLPIVITGGLLILGNLGLAIVLAIRLIAGRSMNEHRGSDGHYPKYAALRRAQRKRSDKRHQVEVRLARLRFEERRGQ